MLKRLLPWLVDALPLALGGLLLAILVSTWGARIPYPYDLEWMEGGMLVHALRLHQGLPIYTDPGPEWIPYIYPPGMPAVVGLLAHFFELGHPLGRAVSLAGVLSAALAMVYGVGRHGRSWSLGLGAALVFLGCYQASGAFYDLVRNDGLLVGILSWSILMALDERRGAAMASGLLLAAAFLVKHNAALFGLPLLLGFWARGGWRDALRFAAWSLGPALASVLFLEWATGGRFLWWILAVPGAHGVKAARMWPGFGREMAAHLPVALVAASAFLVWRSAERVRRRPSWSLWILAGLGASLSAVVAVAQPRVPGISHNDAWMSVLGYSALGAALVALVATPLLDRRRLGSPWVFGAGIAAVAVAVGTTMRGHTGGFLNVYVPIHWAIVLGFGVALGRTRQHLPAWAGLSLPALLLAGQLGYQLYDTDTERLLPTAEDQAAGDALVERLRTVQEPVWSPYAPWLAHQAGHPASFHLIALWDINDKDNVAWEGAEAVRQAAADHYWGTIVQFSSSGRRKLGFGTDKSYRILEDLDVPGRALSPKTGWRVRPDALLVPIWSPGQGPGHYPTATTGQPTDRRLFQVAKRWSVLDLGPDGSATWAGRPVDDLEAQASSAEVVWLRAPSSTPAALVGEHLAALARAHVREVHLAVAGEGESVIVLSPRPSVTPGHEDLGPVSVSVDPASGWAALGPMVVPSPAADVTLTLDDLTALFEELDEGRPPLIVVAAVPEQGCDLGCAVQRLEAVRALPHLAGATLAPGWSRRPADELTEEVDLTALAESIRHWGGRRVSLPPPE